MNAAARVAALVLAAGRSSRMAPHNKLLLRDPAGHAMVARVAGACLASRAAVVIVVTGHQAAEVTRAVQRADCANRCQFVHAPDFAAGLSASLRAGVRALPPWMDGVIVCLGDMPLVGAGMIDRMIAAFDPAFDTAALVPVWQGKRGNPVLWNQTLFAALCELPGDAGGRPLLARYQDHVTIVEADGPGVLTDYDTRAVLPACWHPDAAALS